MTKAKSKFAKTLLALLVVLALAIAMLGGGLATLGASAEEELAADTLYLKVGDTVVTEAGYGNHAKNGFHLVKKEGKYNDYTFDYELTISPSYGKFVVQLWINNATFTIYNCSQNNTDAGNGHVAKIEYESVSDGKLAITPQAVGENICKATSISTAEGNAANGKHMRIHVIVKEAEVNKVPFSLRPLAINMLTDGGLVIATGQPANVTMNNKQGASGVDDYLKRIKFYIKDKDTVFDFKCVPEYSVVNIHYNSDADGNVVYYLRKTTDQNVVYQFKEGDAIIIEKGWRLIEEFDGAIQYKGTDNDLNILELDRTYKWIYHVDKGASSGHFGYEATAVKGMEIGAEDATVTENAVAVAKDSTVNLKGIMYASLGAVDGGQDAATCPADPDGEINGVKISAATWEVIDGAEYASVNADTGVVTGLKKGTAKIKATSKVDTNVSATITVNVILTDEISGVSINAAKTTIENRETLDLSATLVGGPDVNADTATYAWTSTDQKVATVDNNGKVTGVAPGQATIIVVASNDSTPDGVSAQIDITVVLCPTDVTGVTINVSKTTITVGDDLSPTAVTTGGSKKDEATVVWSVSDNTIVQIDEDTGALSALKAGKFTLTVTVTGKTGEVQTANVEITVNAKGSNNNNEGGENKEGGCGSSAVGTSAIAGIVLLAAALVVVASKKKERN